jgi:hypothetical protein
LKKLILFFVLILSITTFAQSDTTLIQSHLKNITKQMGFRNYENLYLLNETAEYIQKDFLKYSDSVSFQKYKVGREEYKNVIASFGTENKKRIIIGAHYDVCGNQEGADDNASGTVGLLELARMLKGKKLNYRIDLVAYTLEEPPYFRTEYMGSYIHAKYLADNKIDVFGMVSLEMIGFFKDDKNTQEYPLNILKLIYGNKGNYITLVKKFGSGKFSRKFSRQFKRSKKIRTKKFVGPKVLPGIDFSDHLNYWKFNFSALMLTDTAFYRNKNYHEKGDKMETLDINRMAKVIDGVLESVLGMK